MLTVFFFSYIGQTQCLKNSKAIKIFGLSIIEIPKGLIKKFQNGLNKIPLFPIMNNTREYLGMNKLETIEIFSKKC